MKIVYIAHPIGGDVEKNLEEIREIVLFINSTISDVVPFVPYYADVVSMPDHVPEYRARGIMNDMVILRSGIVYELWLTGSRISEGMHAEMIEAKKLGIPVRNYIGTKWK